MATPPKEVRIYVPESAHILLSARADAFDEDIGAVAKRIVMEWVKRESHAHRIAAKRFRDTGIEPDLFGWNPDQFGSDPDRIGSSRKGGR